MRLANAAGHREQLGLCAGEPSQVESTVLICTQMAAHIGKWLAP